MNLLNFNQLFHVEHSIKCLLFLSLGILLTSFYHPFYISVCEINHNEENKTLEISIKVFTDDLENALREEGKGILHLDSNKEIPKSDSIIGAFVKKHLILKSNKKDFELEFIGREYVEDLTWAHFQINKVKRLKELTVHNSIFFGLLEGQKNIIHLKYKGEKYNLLLKEGHEKEQILF